jgi:hypothetical protein
MRKTNKRAPAVVQDPVRTTACGTRGHSLTVGTSGGAPNES